MTSGQSAAAVRATRDPLRALPSELRFIVDACRSDRRPATPTGLDWAVVGQGLERHGVTRLIPQLLATPGLVPAEAVAPLRRLQIEQATAGLSQIEETVRVAALLDRADIRFLLIKGRALSIQLYGQPGIRGSKDIDLFVEPGSGARVDAILRSIGYTRPDEDCVKDQVPGFVAKEVGYLNYERKMLVEVHARLTENTDLYAADFETLWESRDTVTVGGRSLPVMARERLATYLCVHGARHRWARLMWLLDIVPLTRSPEEIDAVLADARSFGLEPVLLHSLWMLHHWLGHDVPADVLARARSSRAARILNRMAILYHTDPRWYAQAPRLSWRRFFQNSLFGRVTGYSMKPKLGYWRRQLSLDLVSPADRMIVTLPSYLDWAYVALRPFGWLIRRVRK